MTGVRDSARRYLAGGGCGDMDLLDALPTSDGLRAEVEAEGARRRVRAATAQRAMASDGR